MPDNPQPADLAAHLEAVLTERFTELGNPFSEMRRREQGPDGWPASHPVGPHQVAEVLRELLAAAPVDRGAIIAEILPTWEAVYEPGTVSDYLIGYANDEAPAKAAAEAWMRSQAEVTGRLEWVPDEQLATGRYDQWFELIERHADGIDTGPGLIVRRRVAEAWSTDGGLIDEAQQPETQLPFIHVDDDGDQLDIGAVMASTYDGEAPVVYVAADQHQGDQVATVYVRPERVDEVIAALRSARQAAETLPAAVSQPGKEPTS